MMWPFRIRAKHLDSAVCSACGAELKIYDGGGLVRHRPEDCIRHLVVMLFNESSALRKRCDAIERFLEKKP